MTGCITDDNPPGPPDPNGSENGNEPPPPPSADEWQKMLDEEGLEFVEETGLYRFKDTRKISVELFDRGLDDGRTKPETSYWSKWIQFHVLKDLNIEVEFDLIPRWTEDEVMAQRLAAGNAPDIMYTYTYSTILTYAEMNGIWDMQPFVDDFVKATPNLWDLLGAELIYFNKHPKDGTIWAIEGLRAFDTRINTFVRGDWLETLNLSEPTTIEEFEAMLYAFKDNAELLLGPEAHRMVPFTLNEDVGWRTEHLLSAFVPHNITDKEMYIYGYCDRRFTFPGIKEGVRKLNDWYNNGLIWSEFNGLLGQTGNSAEDNNSKAGYTGAMIHNWNYPYRTSENLQGMLKDTVGPHAGWIPVAAFKDDAGTYRKFMPPKNDLKIFFPATNKEPLASLLYLDWISQLEVRSYLGSGELGINFELVDGAPRRLQTHLEDNPLRNEIFTSEEGIINARTNDNTWTYYELIMNSPQNRDYLMTFNTDSNLFYQDLYTSGKSMGFAYPSTTPDVIARAFELTSLDARISKNVQVGAIAAEKGMSGTLKDKRNTALARAIVCSPSEFEAVWKGGMDDYLASGGQAIIDERTEKWEEFYGDAVMLP